MQTKISDNASANEFPEIQEKINEAELYLTQGLFEEARQIYQELLKEVASLGEQGVADHALLQSYKNRRAFIQEQLATIDRQEAEFHGHAPEAPVEKAAAPQKEEGSAAFSRGQAFLDIGMFTDAIQEFQRAAKFGFQPTECCLQIGKAYIQLGQHGEGIQVLKEAYKRKDLSETDRNLVLAQLAVGYETAGDKEEALQIYQKLAERDPQHVAAAEKVKTLATEGDRYYFNMVKLHLKNKQFSKAIKTLRQMEKEKQASPAEVMPFYEQILEKDPGNKEAIEEVTTIYSQMLDNGGVGVDTRLKFARLLLRTGQFDKAANEYLEVMLEDTPYKITALSELGEALLERQDYDRILELLEDAVPWVESLDPGPETLNYYILLGKACEKKHDRTSSGLQRLTPPMRQFGPKLKPTPKILFSHEVRPCSDSKWAKTSNTRFKRKSVRIRSISFSRSERFQAELFGLPNLFPPHSQGKSLQRTSWSNGVTSKSIWKTATSHGSWTLQRGGTFIIL